MRTVILRGFRDGAWLNPRRAQDYAIILIVAQAAQILWILSGSGINDPLGRPVGTDFLSFWTVSWALLHGQAQAIYVPDALAALEKSITHHVDTAYFAWQYPPVALLLVAPLALFPYLLALALWLAFGLWAYVQSLARIQPGRLTPLLALAFPAVWATITHGQTSVIAVPVLTWGLITLPRSPILAGTLFGLLTFKPQFALLVPVALLAGGYWQSLVAMAASVAALVVLTVALFGVSAWIGFFHGLALTRAILDQQLVPYYKMQSAFAGCRLLGCPLSIAYELQLAVAISAIGCVAWVWRSGAPQPLKNAALTAALPLGSPFFLDYDLMILAPAIAWVTVTIIADQPRAWEKTILTVAFVVPLIARVLGEAAHLPVTPEAVTALLAMILLRARA